MSRKEETWKVRAIGVSFTSSGQRKERPIEEYSKAELRKIAEKKNIEALAAAGYEPAEKNAKAM